MATKRYRSSDEANNVCGRISETLPVIKKANLQRYFTDTTSTCTRLVIAQRGRHAAARQLSYWALRYWALQCEDSDFPFPNPPL